MYCLDFDLHMKTFLLALCITCYSWPLLQNWTKIVEPRITTRWGANSVCVQFQRRIYLYSWIRPCRPKVDPLSGRRSLEWSFTKVYGWANSIDCKGTLFRCSSCSKTSFFIGCTYFILKICLIHLSTLSTNFFIANSLKDNWCEKSLASLDWRQTSPNCLANLNHCAHAVHRLHSVFPSLAE